MKKWVLLVLLGISLSSSAQLGAVVYFSVPQFPNATIKINHPIHQHYYSFGGTPFPLSAAGTFTLHLDTTQTGPMFLAMASAYAYLYVQPGDTIHVTYDTTQTKRWTFRGSNEMGQYLLNSGDIPIEETYDFTRTFAKDTGLTMLVSHIEAEKSAKLEKAGALYDKRQITEGFFQYVQKNLDYMYAAILSNRLKNIYASTMRQSGSYQEKLDGFTQQYGMYWTALFEYFSPNDPGLRKLPAFRSYANSYLEDYLLQYVRALQGDSLPPQDYIQASIALIRQNFKEEAATQVTANQLYYAYLQRQFNPSLIGMYDFFLTLPLAKHWAPLLEKQHQEVVAFNQPASLKAGKDQQYLRVAPTFQQLYQQELKGKRLFVDIWATWCGPCKDEFKYKDSIEAMLRSYRVETLYLSMEPGDGKIEDQWRRMINFYQLKGLHVRANQQLFDQVMQYAWAENEMRGSIPRYLIIDEHGVLLEQNAARPSQPQLLRNQLEKHFGKKGQ